MTCAIKRCGGSVTSRGWCSKHYMRWRKYGDPNHAVRVYRERPTVCLQDGDDCSVDSKVIARGFCAKHYTRFMKHGDASVVKPQGATPVDVKERFEAKYLVDPHTGCWLWTGATNGHGWPTLSIDGRATMAHRYAYETFRGPIPGGNSVRRDCGQVSCVCPDHLSLVSKDPVERFWTNVKKQPGKGGHWLWEPTGFSYRVSGEVHNPRMYAWQLVRGEPADFLYPTCHERVCVRPEHAGASPDRFWSKVEKAKDGCWYWRGSKLSSGYPHLTYQGKSVYAHRLAWEWAGGVPKEGCVLNHTCHHLDCVRPDHLKQITQKEMVALREKRRVPVVCPTCGETFRNLPAHAKAHEPRP